MNWQLLENVNPPIGKVFVLFEKTTKDIYFAKRTETRGKIIEYSQAYRKGDLEEYHYRMPYKEFKSEYGANVYWSLLIKP